MHYYIDGYNLLFRVLRAGDDLRKQREELTLDLEKKIGALELDATLVFDSHYQEDDGTRSHFKSLEIVFTAKNETADDYILHRLKESPNPSQQTVVTSDKKLAYQCRMRLGKTESAEEFLTNLNRRYKNKMVPRKPVEEVPLQKRPPPPKKAVIPPESAPAEGCFDYYLNAFETEAELLVKESSKKPPRLPEMPQELESKKPKKKKPTKEESHLSDMQRWLNAFEKGEL